MDNNTPFGNNNNNNTKGSFGFNRDYSKVGFNRDYSQVGNQQHNPFQQGPQGVQGQKNDNQQQGSQQLVNLPKGGGAIQSIGEKFETNPVTGTFSMSVPLAISPGRGGFTPQLGLSYNSGSGNGVFGVGWGVGIPNITRKTDKGLPKYNDGDNTPDKEADTFILSGAEDLVPKNEAIITNGDYTIKLYIPRTEGLFARIERWRHKTGKIHWRTVSKANITTVYGQSPEASVYDSQNPNKTFSWNIEYTYGAKGQVIWYRYKKEDAVNVAKTANENNRLKTGNAFNQVYLDQVKYSNQHMYKAGDDLAAINWHFTLVFDYGNYTTYTTSGQTITPTANWPAREDAFSTYKAGFEIRTYRLCQRVLMFHHFSELGANAILTKSTELSYQTNPYLTQLQKITHKSHDGAATAAMPPMTFTYSKAEIGKKLHQVDPKQLENLPAGVNSSTWQFTDLYGEGLNGVLRMENHAWYYKHNHGDKNQYQEATEITQTTTPDLQLGGLQTLTQIPSAQNTQTSNYYLGDVDSDSQPELVLKTQGTHGYFTLEDGKWQNFRPFAQMPNINTNDPNVKMIDLTGDGLADMLISRGTYFEMYFSSGKEGYKDYRRINTATTEEQGPVIVFSEPKQSIYLADMTGDGLTDIVRITHNSTCYWPNMGYGRFGDKVYMKNTPAFDTPDIFHPSRIKLADIDGTGTTDIIYLGSKRTYYYKNQCGNGWSNKETINAFPFTDHTSQVHITDLLGNGTTCLVWSSPLPAHQHNMRFVELTSGIKPYLLTSFENNIGRQVTLKYAPSTKFYIKDKLAGKPWITRLPFPVHVLEQVEDHEQITGLKIVNRYAYHHGHYDTAEREFRGFGMVEQWDTEILPIENKEQGVEYQPPVYTKKWFHTGFYKNRDNISSHYKKEYFSGDNQAWFLPDTPLPEGLTPEETREACRALRGQMLRSEVYAQDGTENEDKPYLVEEKSIHLQILQPKRENKHGVFLTTDSETISYHYERNTEDPRIQHALTLETDEYGNILKSAQLAYPRREPEGKPQEQTRLKIIITQNDVINHTTQDINNPVNQIGIPYQSQNYELTGFPFSGQKFDTQLVQTLFSTAPEIDYATTPNSGLQKRCFQHQKTLYYNQELTQPLPEGEIANHALPYQSLTADLTDTLLAQLTQTQPGITKQRLINEGKYQYQQGKYWLPTEIATHDATKFYQPIKTTDPFGNQTQITYDTYNLFIAQITDAQNNQIITEHDYRVLQAKKITDPNQNTQQVGFDTLGMVTKLAIQGKNGEGDTLNAPTITYDYDLNQWQDHQKPLYAHVKTRETHKDANTHWLESYVYSGGHGNPVMAKVQAEDGEVNGTPCTNRWVGTGRTILNNKGNIIKQYEPYFSNTHAYEDETAITQNGVTPILYYDPIGRNIKTQFPDGTLAKVEFSPWQQKNYDQNDTVLESQWYTEAQTGTTEQQRAAQLAAAHANTPQQRHFDNLGREYQIDDDNANSNIYTVHNQLDIAGRPTLVTDAKGRAMTQLTQGMQQPFITQNIDSGTRWVLNDVAGKPIYSWDSRSHETQHSYDALQRPLNITLKANNETKVVEKTIYGTDPGKNNIGQIAQQYDQSGQTVINNYDFKGNPLSTTKTFAGEYKTYIDWTDQQTVLPSSSSFHHSFTYDALNRPVSKTLPDGTTETYTYNKAGLLETVTNGGKAYVNNINYNEKGQRTDIYYGNNSKTRYTYDKNTFRLTRLLTTRNNGADILQDLNYTYDPVGNITEQIDNAQQTHYFNNAQIAPKGQYTYDALYRLKEATGRELASLQMPTHEDFPNNIPNTNTAGNAMQNYTQQYTYDELGNMLKVKSNGQWTRDYYYNFAANNYLIGHTENTTEYTYDQHGNMLTMPHLQALNWDYKDQLQNVALDASGNKAWYSYDAGGNRTRKVIEKGNIKEERYYLGDYEVYRKFVSGTLDTERTTVDISDDKKKITTIDKLTVDQGSLNNDPTPVIRYQYDNHLGSASLELDQNADIISYEEYHPFGTTSYRSGRSETETSQKRYKYVGKERDEETGLYYYGARYYAAWICRFVSVDPLNDEYPDLSSYQYASNRPIIAIDLDGLEAKIVITGTYWKERIASELGDGKNPDGVLKAYHTSLTALATTLEDIEKGEKRDYAKRDWGGNSPAAISRDGSIEGVMVIYGEDENGSELSFTFNMERIEEPSNDSSWYKPVLEFLGWLDEKANGGGGFRLTWELGQGQESREAKYKDIDTVAIDDLMTVLGVTKGAAGTKNWKNLAETLNVAFGNFGIGQDIVSEVQKAVDKVKDVSGNQYKFENRSDFEIEKMEEKKKENNDSTIITVYEWKKTITGRGSYGVPKQIKAHVKDTARVKKDYREKEKAVRNNK